MSTFLPRIFSILVAFWFQIGTTSQVYTGTNAVGYINTTIVPGFNLITSPLLANGGFTISNLTEQIQGGVPDGLSVFVLEADGYHRATYDAATGSFEPAEMALKELPPGVGFFLFNPSPTPMTVTFVGQIPTGSLTNHLRAGFSLVASMVPMAGTLEQHEFPAEPGDVVYRFNSQLQRFEASMFDDIAGTWLPAIGPIQVGEGFVVWKRNATDWVREFSIIP